MSYRRQDASGHAGRLADGLIIRLGRERVFVDVDSIDPGQDFVAAILQAVSRSDVLLVVIGLGWLNALTDDGIRRLDLRDDFVRIEIESALDAGIAVVPVLVEGASMPTEQELPESLRPLSRRNAVMLHDTQWSRDLDHLIRKLSPRDERDQPEAQEGYWRPRSVPRDELGLEPAPVLTALHQGVPAQDRRLAAPIPSHPHNLPAATSRLIGRSTELAAIGSLLHRPDVRLVTLTGVGGVGKTRLALATAESVRTEYAGGTFAAWLATIAEPADILGAIARALKLTGSPGEPLAETIARALAIGETLLLLDNFEHVMPAAPLVADLLSAAPGLRVLATSRAPLHVSGEHEYHVPPLQLPDRAGATDLAELAKSEAIALFVARAAAIRPDFALSQENASAVAEVCVRLDGLPLAIELAAGRSKVLALPDMLIRLENRLALLTGGPRDQPARQQTLRATIDWTYHLLGPDERGMFEQLSVFVGGATFAAANAVCAPDDTGDEVLDKLQQLLDQSLLVRDDIGVEPRYTALETIREYALERLSERLDAPDIRMRHARFFLALAEQGEVGLRTSQHPEWLSRLDAEYGNLRAAFETLRGGPDPALSLRLTAALLQWWEARDTQEGLNWLVGAFDGADPRPERAKALYAIGRLTLWRGDYPQAVAALRESVALAVRLGDRQIQLLAMGLLGWALGEQGHAAEARSIAAACLRELGTVDDPWTRAEALRDASVLACHAGDLERAAGLQEQSLGLRRQMGDDLNIADSLNNLGYIFLAAGELGRARGYLQDCLAIARRLDDALHIMLAQGTLGLVALFEGNYAESIALLTSNATLCHQRGNRRSLAEALHGLGVAYAADGRPEHGARLVGAGRALEQPLGIPPQAPFLYAEVERLLAAARNKLGDTVYATLLEEGRALPVEAALRYAQDAAATPTLSQ